MQEEVIAYYREIKKQNKPSMQAPRSKALPWPIMRNGSPPLAQVHAILIDQR